MCKWKGYVVKRLRFAIPETAAFCHFNFSSRVQIFSAATKQSNRQTSAHFKTESETLQKHELLNIIYQEMLGNNTIFYFYASMDDEFILKIQFQNIYIKNMEPDVFPES